MGGKGVGGAVQAVRIANDSCVDMRTEQTTLKNLQTPCEKKTYIPLKKLHETSPGPNLAMHIRNP